MKEFNENKEGEKKRRKKMKAIDKLLEIGFTKTLDNHNEVIWKLDDENGKETLSFGVIKGVKAVFIKGGFSLELGYIILNYIKELEKEEENEKNMRSVWKRN